MVVAFKCIIYWCLANQVILYPNTSNKYAYIVLSYTSAADLACMDYSVIEWEKGVKTNNNQVSLLMIMH